MSVLEKLAEIEHEQWMSWAKSILPELENLTKNHISICACPTCNRIKRWKSFFVSYNELPEKVKEEDRKWARMVLKAIKEAGEK